MIVIRAENPSEWTGPTGNNTYLLPGSVPTLIDAGVGHPAHLEALEIALDGAALAQVLITHGHQDHVAGIPRIRERWPGVVVRNYPPDTCEDNELIPAGNRSLRALHTPGHAPDHFCFLDEETAELYCGDLARVGGTIVIPVSTGGNLVEYLASLERIRSLAPRRLLPGHGPPATDPVALIDEYVRHRHAREAQVLTALRAGASSIDEIVERVYGALPAALRRAAGESVHAHLIKLSAEARVQGAAARWTLACPERSRRA